MAKIKRKKSSASKKVLAHIRVQRGLDRQNFIEENGDMKQWIPPRVVYTDRKKKDSRMHCRRFKTHGY